LDALAPPLVPRDQIPDMPDRLIAATALASALPLVTRGQNVREAGIVPAVW